MSIKSLYVTEAKIRTRQGFKSGNKSDQGNGTVILGLFCFALQLTF